MKGAGLLKKAEDRRVRRTHRLLKESLLELLKQKAFSNITVSDITEKADVNRATFYLHFANPAQLLQSIGDDLLEQAQALIDTHSREIVGGESLRPLLEQVLDFVLESQELCTLLFAYEQESLFAEKLLGLIQERGTEIVRAKSDCCQEQEIPYVVDFITCGLMGLIRTWFCRGMDIPKKELLDAAELLTDGAAFRFITRV